MSVLVGGEKRSVFNWHLKCQQKFFEKSKSDVRARARYRFAMTWFLRAETLRWRAERFWSFIVAPKWFFFYFFFRKAQKSHEIMHNRAKLISSNWFRHSHRVEAQNKLFFSIARQRTIRNTCEWLTNQSARSLESGRHERSNITATMFRLTMSLNLIWFIGFNQPNCARRNKSMEREEEKKVKKKTVCQVAHGAVRNSQHENLTWFE